MIVGDVKTLLYYENVGSTTTPAFEGHLEVHGLDFAQAHGLDFSSLVTEADDDAYYGGGGEEVCVVPTLVDLDGDSDLDLLLGAADGRLHYFENGGTATVPQFASVPVELDSVSVARVSAPAIGDIDGDGAPRRLCETKCMTHVLFT